MENTNYEKLNENYEKYSSWHKNGNSLMRAIGFSNAMDPNNLEVYFRVFSNQGEQFEQINILFLNSLEKISLEKSTNLLSQWGFEEEAEKKIYQNSQETIQDRFGKELMRRAIEMDYSPLSPSNLDYLDSYP